MAKKKIELKPLRVGDTVPSLKPLQWVKGTPIDIGEKVTLVEVWATWCGPCLDSIPHLTELQKKYAEKLDIVGFTVEKKKEVLPFVKDMGDSMDYRVAIAPESLYDAYTEGIEGIPHSFLVGTDGKLILSCHPMAIDPILEGLLSGKKTSKELTKLAVKKKKFDEVSEEFGMGSVKNPKRTLQKFCEMGIEILQDFPNDLMIFYNVMQAANSYQEFDVVESFCKGIDKDKIAVDTLIQYVEYLLDMSYNSKICFENTNFLIHYLLKREPKNPYVLYHYSRVLHTMGLVEKAVGFLKQAIKLDSENSNPNFPLLLETYQNFLEIRKKYKY